MRKIYPLIFSVVLILSFLGFLSFNRWYEIKIEKIEERFNNKAKERETYIDSLYNKLDNLYHILDSLPIGAPLDTVIIQDDYGVRRHPIFGRWQMHSGVDMIDTWHDTVYATASGVVRYASWNYGYGRCIEIEHAFGFTTKYAHLHKLFVKKRCKYC